MRQRLRQRCRYQLDSTVSNGLVHTGAAVAAVPQGAASKWVPTLFYAAVYVASGCGKNPCSTAAAPCERAFIDLVGEDDFVIGGWLESP